MQRSAIIFACFTISFNCLAQQYPYVHYTPRDGLVNSRVLKAYQDSKGPMYFLTYGGLSVYDGTRFRNYNTQAVEVAERASTDWVKRLMGSTAAEVPWGELKAYHIQEDMVLKKFLVTLDATFLTSSSIIAEHFDGPSPAKFVFSPDRDLGKEVRMARTPLLSVLQQYTANMAVKENIYILPTPYWAGHKAYHITRDIAKGLMLNGKKYTP